MSQPRGHRPDGSGRLTKSATARRAFSTAPSHRRCFGQAAVHLAERRAELFSPGALALRAQVLLRSRFAEDQLAAAVPCGGGQYVILGLARGHLACGTRPGTVFGVSVPPRLLVTGNSGSGKTTLARLLASDLGIPHVELDGLYHGPGWTPADPDKFRARVRAATAEPAWVIDGNYTSIVGQILRDRAGLVIALDLPRWRVMARITRRTLARIVTRAELWNGNREQWRNLLTLDPDNNIVLWAWTRHRKYHQRAVAEEHVEHRQGPPTVRLASPAQVRRFRRLLLSRVERPYRDARTTRSRSRNLFRSKWPGLGALRPSAA